MLLALLVAAATPWVEMSAGPVMLHRSGQNGMSSGPMVRLEAGYPLADRFAAELWLSGAIQHAPLRSPGDTALVGAGAGARFRMSQIDGEGRLTMWAHVGAGWGATAAGSSTPGPTGFAGLLLSFQPFIQRFQIGLEANAVAYRQAYGFALLPSLRCSF